MRILAQTAQRNFVVKFQMTQFVANGVPDAILSYLTTSGTQSSETYINMYVSTQHIEQRGLNKYVGVSV